MYSLVSIGPRPQCLRYLLLFLGKNLFGVPEVMVISDSSEWIVTGRPSILRGNGVPLRAYSYNGFPSIFKAGNLWR